MCGDIHGSYSCVQRFLSESEFDFDKDRLICAGDLIDRGPENERCLDLLYEPWFFSTVGNHEQLMLAFSTSAPDGRYWETNGGTWGVRYFKNWTVEYDEALGEKVRRVCADKVKNLPHLITVEKRGGGIFHVLHAELPLLVGITDEVLADPVKLEELTFSHNVEGGDFLTWSRNIFFPFYRRELDEHTIKKIRRGVALNKIDKIFSPKLSHIYSGHTICAGPVIFFGQTNLDTMAYSSYYPNAKPWAGLTVTEPETGRFWRSNDREFVEIQPTIIL